MAIDDGSIMQEDGHPIQQAGGPALPPEIVEGQTFAILSYALSLTLLPFFFVPLIFRNNSFSLYHAKQSLVLWILGVVSLYVGSLLMVFCVGFLIIAAALVFLTVLDIVGLIHAIKGEQKPLPLVGEWAEMWFKGIRKI
jgi:uncharacterized membrane protein